ncbi:MAG TPA: sulfite exporter TauE/SafE family protein [Patescibacteria group bacterium]|nr:sulfite exporter TauE/SafE family protein [Patescibacteria group bacterium]
MGNTNLLAIFLTGLLTGGLTCMAVQGGLLAATLAQREEERLKQKLEKSGNALPIITFLIAKLAAYTILGFLLGWFGSLFQLSLSTRVIIQFVVAIFMIGTALNILDVHPIFRYFIIQPSKFLTRLVRKQSKSADLFAPAILGAFTIFIPCGTTQAMMALAIASGNPIVGAAILFSFILGTSPLFFILGYFVTKLGDSLQQGFMRFAALAIILLAIFNINNTIALTGSSFTLENLWSEVYCTVSFCSNSVVEGAAAEQAPVTDQDIQITSAGYNPNDITVKAGAKITFHITNVSGAGCVQALTIPSLNLQKIVPVGSSDNLAFVAPTQTGDIPFMCSMGMYRGVIHVI